MKIRKSLSMAVQQEVRSFDEPERLSDADEVWCRVEKVEENPVSGIELTLKSNHAKLGYQS